MRKSVCAVILAGMLVLAMAVPAFASPPTQPVKQPALHTVFDFDGRLIKVGDIDVSIPLEGELADRLEYDGVVLSLPVYACKSGLFVKLPERLGGTFGLGPVPYNVDYGYGQDTQFVPGCSKYIAVSDLRFNGSGLALPVAAHLPGSDVSATAGDNADNIPVSPTVSYSVLV